MNPSDPSFPDLSGLNHPRQFTRVLASAGTTGLTAYACLLNWVYNNDYATLLNFADYSGSVPDLVAGDRLTISITDGLAPVADFEAVILAVESDYLTIAPKGTIALLAASDNFSADETSEILTITDGTIPSNWVTGQACTVAADGGSLPTGLAEDTTYYLIIESTTELKLASSFANAIAGTAIDLITAGVGDTIVTLENYTRNATVTAHLQFREAAFYGLKAAQTDNVADAYVGPTAGSNAQPIKVLAGAGPYTVGISEARRDNLANWYLETGNNADGLLVHLYN